MMNLPAQQALSQRQQTSSNFFMQKGLKFQEVGYFNSFPAFIFAGICENNVQKSHYIPRPFVWHLPKQPHFTPSFWIKYTDGHREVVELRPKGHMNQAAKQYCERLCEEQSMTFRVIAHEAVLKHTVEGINTWKLIRHLLRWQHENDTHFIRPLMQFLKRQNRPATFHELVQFLGPIPLGLIKKTVFTRLLSGDIDSDIDKYALSKRTLLWLPR